MSTMPTINLTVATATHAPNTSAIIRTINPSNTDEVLISYDGYILAVNKRAWNLLSLNAPVERIISMSDKED